MQGAHVKPVEACHEIWPSGIDPESKIKDQEQKVRRVQSQAAVEQLVRADDRYTKYLAHASIERIVYVPGRIINFVVH